MINLKGYNFLFGKKAVSPVIGTILMVAVTVIMAAIVGGFVYQTARPKIPPTISSSLADDPLEAVGVLANTVNGGEAIADAAAHIGGATLTTTIGNRVAMLYFEGGQNIAITELKALVNFTNNDSKEISANLEGAIWSHTPAGTGFLTKRNLTYGSVMAIGTTAASKVWLVFVDSDGSGDITPGDRLDFFETDGATPADAKGVKGGRDFNVRLLHKATQAFVADHTIRVY